MEIIKQGLFEQKRIKFLGGTIILSENKIHSQGSIHASFIYGESNRIELFTKNTSFEDAEKYAKNEVEKFLKKSVTSKSLKRQK